MVEVASCLDPGIKVERMIVPVRPGIDRRRNFGGEIGLLITVGKKDIVANSFPKASRRARRAMWCPAT
jgi:hypothetical protein